MAKKKLPAITARFGARYGATPRKRWRNVMLKRIRTYTCPSCHKRGVKRESVGIWKCRKCGYTFSGGAYEPFLRR